MSIPKTSSIVPKHIIESLQVAFARHYPNIVVGVMKVPGLFRRYSVKYEETACDENQADEEEVESEDLTREQMQGPSWELSVNTIIDV